MDMPLKTKSTQDESLDEILDIIAEELESVPEPERSERIKAAVEYGARRWPCNERVLVRDCEGKLLEMKAVSVDGGLVYVTRCGDDDGLGSIGVPAEDVFEFTEHPATGVLSWIPHGYDLPCDKRT